MKQIAIALVLVSSLAVAQEPASATGTGIVTGHVICGDTQRPARFAEVVLFGIPAKTTKLPELPPDASQEDKMAAALAGLAGMGKTNMVQSQTGTDGAFTATDVAPGDYYVFGSAAGYVTPLNAVVDAMGSGGDASRLTGIPTLHVTADRASSIDVTMQRGAAISGTISWDDGSPLSGAIFSVAPAKGEVKPPQEFSMLAMASMKSMLGMFSDDLGHYRITGLAPGDYIVKATIQSGQQSGLGAGMNLAKAMAHVPMNVYAPAAFHSKDAKPVTVHAGEDARDVNVTLSLGSTYSVRGQIVSATDNHGINDGTVRLIDKSDKELIRSTAVDAAGNFKVTFVPAGTYTISVENAADTVPDESKKKKNSIFGTPTKELREYQTYKQDLLVADKDVTGQTISLTVDKNPKKDESSAFEKALGAALGDDDEDKTPAK